MDIRPARPEDYEAVCTLMAEGDAYHRERAPRVFRKPDGPARTREYYDALLSDPQQVLFLAEIDGRAAGLVLVQLRESPPIPIIMPRRYAIVDNLAVTRAHRLCGVAQALMERAHAWAREQGVHEIELNVFEFNAAARALYDKLGYVTVTRRMSRLL